MSTSLSSVLQWRSNVFICQKLGWKIAFYYITILGALYFLLKRKEKKKIKKAVEDVFAERKGKREIRSILRSALRGIRSHYLEKFFNAYENIEELSAFFEESIDVSNLHKLENALREGKGVLFVTGHYGGIEYIPIFLALKQYPISVIAKFKTKELKDTLHRKTDGLGLRIIDADKKNRVLCNVIKELRANRIIFIECDEIEEWKPSQKEKISFLGKMIGVDKTINLIHRRTGAAIIFGILHRYSLRNYKFIIENYQDMILRLDKTPFSIGEVVLKSFEKYIYSNPEEWYQWKNYAQMNTYPTRAFSVAGEPACHD